MNFKKWLHKNESLTNLIGNMVSTYTGLPGFDELGLQSSADSVANVAKSVPYYATKTYNALEKTIAPIDSETKTELLKKCKDETSSKACAELCKNAVLTKYDKKYACEIGNCKPVQARNARNRKYIKWKCNPKDQS